MKFCNRFAAFAAGFFCAVALAEEPSWPASPPGTGLVVLRADEIRRETERSLFGCDAVGLPVEGVRDFPGLSRGRDCLGMQAIEPSENRR